MNTRVLLAVVLIVAAGLRFWSLEDVGISHWDAGSYTAGPLEVGPYGKAPILLYYAPPVVPALHELAFAIAGVDDTAAVFVHALLGTLTVLALFLFGRTLVGDVPALLGAAALASMEYHVIFSRQPVTDVAYTFFFLVSTWLLWRSLGFDDGNSKTSRGLAVIAGLVVGLTFATKYHGFFPLVLAGILLVAASIGLVRGSSRKGLRDRWVTLVIAALASAVPAAALFWHIETETGLEAFRDNRTKWLPEAALYILPKTGLYIWNATTTWVSSLVLVAGVIGAVRMCLRRSAGDLLVVGWLGLFLATLPLYHNYPRLLLPLLPPLALAAGVGLDTLVRGRLPVAVVTVIVLVVGSLNTLDTLEVSDLGYAHLAEQLASAPLEDDTVDVLVTQHAALFYLRDAKQPFLNYDEDGALEALEQGRFRHLVFDLRVFHAPEFAAFLAEHRDELELVATIPNPLPDAFVVNLLGFERWQAWRNGELSPEDAAAIETFRVYRPRR